MTAVELLFHLDASIVAAERYESKLGAGGEPLMEVGGFCGLKTRHLWNQLGSLPGINYLEVGVLNGATLLSASYGNDSRFVGVDNFCQDFGGPGPAATRANLAKWGEGKVALLEEDCWEVDLSKHAPFDVFYYDGGHSREETARAFVHFLPVLAPTFLLLVDDYNWTQVRQGVADGCRLCGCRCEALRTLGAEAEGDWQGYWNGLFIAIFRQ